MAFDFTGSSSEYLSTATVPVSAPPFSWMCWGWNDAAVSSRNVLLFLGQSTSNNHYWQMDVSNAATPLMQFQTRDASSFSGGAGGPAQPFNQWNFYGAEIPAPTTNIVVYSQSASASFANGVTPTGPNIFAIGLSARSSPQQPFNGGIGEVAVWNVVLTATDWAVLRNGFDPRLVRPSALVFYRDLIRDLNRPYGPGANLTNTGSIGVRAHVPMRYRWSSFHSPFVPANAYDLSIDAASAALSPVAVTFLAHRVLGIDPADVNLSAVSVNLQKGSILQLSPSGVTATPIDATLLAHHLASVDPASIGLTPVDVTFFRRYIIDATAAAISATPIDVTLAYNAAEPLVISPPAPPQTYGGLTGRRGFTRLGDWRHEADDLPDVTLDPRFLDEEEQAVLSAILPILLGKR